MNELLPLNAAEDSHPVLWLRFADLWLSPLNARQVVDQDAIARLAENISSEGLIQNLAGHQAGDGRVGIVAGGRRLRALALLQDDPRFHHVPVKVTEDEMVARAWAASENHLREALHPADEIREYGAMERTGIPVPAIALAFGVNDGHVHRRLRLAGLPDPVLTALRADEITLGMAACFTLSDDLSHALAVLEQVRGNPVSEQRLRRILKPDSLRDTDRRARFVGEAAYRGAGGRVTRDLFAEETLWDDPDILEQVFGEALDVAAQQFQAEQGWKWAETCREPYIGWHQIEAMKAARVYPEPGDLDDAQAQRYDALSELAEIGGLDADSEVQLADLQAILDGNYSALQKALAGLVVYVDHDGTLSVCAGLVAHEDKAAAEAAGILAPRNSATEAKDTGILSARLRSDLGRIACGARQNACLDHPDLLLDLLAFQLSGRMGYRTAFGLRCDDVPNYPEVDAGYGLDSRLTDPKTEPKDPFGSDLVRAFRSFRKLGHEKIRAELLRQLAALLSVSDEGLGKLIDKEAGTSIRGVWTPTAEGFFKRVNGGFLDELHRDLLGLGAEHPSVTTFARLKKGEKAERLEKLFTDDDYRSVAALSADQLSRVDNWLPDDMG